MFQYRQTGPQICIVVTKFQSRLNFCQRSFFSKTPLIENISKCTFPRCFPGVSQEFPGAIFFSFALLKIPTSFAKEVFFYLNLLLLWCFPGISRVFPCVSRVFPGCSRAQFFSLSFTLLKIPTTFAKEAPLIQNISKCTFPWCFPGISWVFPGCFPGVPEDFFCTLLLLLKIIPTTFVKEVFILKHASLIQNLSKCSFPGCFPGVSRVIPGKQNSRSSLQ